MALQNYIRLNMNSKSLLEIFNEKQLQLLKGKMWWVADRDKPYLLKFSLDNDDNYVLMQLTDLKHLWANRFHINTLLQQKDQFAKSLQMKGSKDLLLLLESRLSESDPEAKYIFSELNGSQINFTFAKRINIYDFSWTFKLIKTTCNSIELCCRQVMNPLLGALEAQTKRIQVIKKRFQQIEKEYIRKMTEMEKTLYKSPLIETEDEWKLLMPPQDGRLLSYIKLDEASKFFCRSSMQQQKKKQVQLLISEPKSKAMLVKMINDDKFQAGEHQLNRHLDKEREKQKKNKVIDFL